MNRYIDRELALSHPFANGKYDHKNANEDFIIGFESYKEWLEQLPAADVRENVHAHWVIETEMVNGTLCSGQFCSDCGYPQYLTTRFCPNCGARMDGE